MKIGLIKIPIVNCTEGIYLRWYWNGYHAFLFRDGYQITMKTESMDTQVTRMFSVISKIERPTRIKSEYAYQITLSGITAANIGGFTGLLLSEKVEQYEGGIWREVDITRGDHLIRDESSPGYILDFEITRKELPYTSSVYQKSQKLYIGDTLCDIDDDEVIPINKQVNDIAEMQDRQSDFTAQFQIRKTRAMRSLFELSGEVGAITNFPYQKQNCRLIQDGIEIISNGMLILDGVDKQYYHVAILSGNLNFFKVIDNKKITSLSIASVIHNWTYLIQAATHASDLDYVYPLFEPSENADMTPHTDTGDLVNLWGGWVWPFVKAKAIWDQIFTEAGYTYSGDISTDKIFARLFLPIASNTMELTVITPYLYLYKVRGLKYNLSNLSYNKLWQWNGKLWETIGDLIWNTTAIYVTPFYANYIFTVELLTYSQNDLLPNHVYVNVDGVRHEMFRDIYEQRYMTINLFPWYGHYTSDSLNILSGKDVYFEVSYANKTIWEFTLQVKSITDLKIGYGDLNLNPVLYLPDLTQTDFIKMISNMFGLIPSVEARDKTIRFWNYEELYDNIPLARDWSAYLSEKEDSVEFKFGEYAQNNYLKYKDSNDVVQNKGNGIMPINDTTLEVSKDVVDLPVSFSDEVVILSNPPESIVARINYYKWDSDNSVFVSNNRVDPRIVYIDHTQEIGSPLYQKEFQIRNTEALPGSLHADILSPKKASTAEISFSQLGTNYVGLVRLLTKTNLRRCKFNLPAYEVAGLKHYIPIYLSQYKAYFYVNKINNYVPGKLCQIDLIKL